MISDYVNKLHQEEEFYFKEEKECQTNNTFAFINMIKNDFKYINLESTEFLYLTYPKNKNFIDLNLLKELLEEIHLEVLEYQANYVIYHARDYKMIISDIDKANRINSIAEICTTICLFSMFIVFIIYCINPTHYYLIPLLLFLWFIPSSIHHQEATPTNWMHLQLKNDGLNELTKAYCLEFLENKLKQISYSYNFPPTITISKSEALDIFGRWDKSFINDLIKLYEEQGMYTFFTDSYLLAFYLMHRPSTLHLTTSKKEKEVFDNLLANSSYCKKKSFFDLLTCIIIISIIGFSVGIKITSNYIFPF